MSQTHTPTAAWTDLQGLLSANGPTEQMVHGADSISPIDRKDWQAILTGPLAAWDKDPESLADDGVEPPSRRTIRRATDLAQQLCAAHLAAPQRIAATADGGIVLARQD